MSRRESGKVFIGRLSRNIRREEVEDAFETYGRIVRCDIKSGIDGAFAFIDYEDRRDAEDAIRNENGRELGGSVIIAEWAKGERGSRMDRRSLSVSQIQRNDECFRCHRIGHWSRECPMMRGGDRYNRGSYGGGGGGGGGRRSPNRGRSPYRSSRRSRSRSPYRRRRSRSRSRDIRRSRSRSISRSPTPQRKRNDSRDSRSKSPRRDSKSPKNGKNSRSRSPHKRSRSKTPKDSSPKRKSRSISKQRESRSPRRDSRSPRRDSRSPRRDSRSPRRESKSPMRDSRSRSRHGSVSPHTNGRERSPIVNGRSGSNSPRSD